MRASADPGLVKRLSVFASATSVFSVVVGLSGLAGWGFRISGVTTWGIAPVKMVANTAACFVLIGVSLWLLRKHGSEPITRVRRFAANTVAATAALIGLASLAEHLFGLDLGIDQALAVVSAADHAAGVRPGLMSSLTALDFLILGLALVMLDWRTRRNDWPAQFLCLAAALPASFGLLALFLSPRTYPTTMAWPTAVTFFVLVSGLPCSRATWALGGLLTSQNSGARLLRRATPAALIVLSFIGWLISKPLLADSHFTWVQVSVLAVFSSAALAGFIAWVAFIVERSDTQRRKIEDAFAGRKEELDRILNRIEEPEAEALLRRKVEAGFVVAVLLTSLLGILSWRANRQAAEDADWVAHAQEVSTTLELTLRHLVDVETGGRGFALTGDGLFLESYESGKQAVTRDLERLSILVADNPDQRRRLDLLRQQANARIEASQESVALRQKTGNLPTQAHLLHGKQLMDSTRATVAAMEAEENRLLGQRSQHARSAQRLAVSVITLGSVVGVVFLSIAGFTVSREIGISARARAEVNLLNADLEQRVAERTAALGESEGRLSSIIQSAMDSIITTDDQQRILVFNKAAETMFRCPAAEVLGQSITRFIPERFQAAHHGHFKKFAGNGATTRTMAVLGTLWGVRADGEEFRIEASISHIHTGGKNLSTVILRDITERVRAQAVREHLAAVVDSSDDAIISKDLNGIINGWNRGAEKIFGYTAAEAIGKPMLMLFPPELVPEEAGILARIGRGESVEHYETVRVRKDGNRIDVSVTISPIRDSAGTVVGASKIARDITERKHAEEALHKSEENFRMLWDSMDEAFCVIEMLFDQDDQPVDYRFLEVNPAFAKHTGMENAQGRRIRELQPQQEEYWYQILGQVARTGRSVRFENEAAQLHRWFEVHAFRVGDPRANKVAILFSDISERKQAEAALRESEERFHTLIEQASDAFFLHDGDGRFLDVNRQACESLGYTREELLGMCVFDVEQEVDKGKTRQAWEQAEPGKAYTIQGRQRRRDGTTFPIEVRLSAYYVDGKKLHLGLVRDTTERQLAEEALRRSDAGRVVALEAANLGEWEIDLSTQQSRRSRRHDQIFGYASPPQWSAEIFFQHVHPDDRARARMNLEMAIRQGTKLETECRIILPDGEMRWIRACGDRYRDASGLTTRMFGTVEDITERKNAAEALRLSEERVRLAMDGAQLGTWHWNLETGELAWSPRCLAMFGLPLGAEMSYEIFRAALHPDDRVPTDEAVQHSLDERSGYDIEYRAIWPDGSQHWIAAKGQGYYDATGKAVRMEGVVLDVTERREAQERLRKSEEDYRTLFNSMDEGFCTIEILFDLDNHPVDYRFVEVNPAFEKQSGIVEPVGKRMREIAPEHEEYWFQIYGRIALTGEPARFENFAGRLHRWFDIYAFRVGEGAERKVAVLFSDITERKRMEETRERLAAVVDSSDDAIIGKDLNGIINAWNHGAEKVFGYTTSETIGRPMLMLFPPERVEEEAGILARIRRGESVEHFETVRVRKDATKIDVSVTISPIRDSNGAVVGASKIARDITERKRAEERLAGQAEELSRQTEALLRSQGALETQTLMLQSVLDSMAEGLVAADETGKFILWNPAATRIVGMGAHNVPPGEWNSHYGVYLPDTVTPLPAADNPLVRAVQGETCSAEIFIRNSELDQGNWLEISGGPLKDSSGAARGGVVAFRDITQRKIDEQKIRALNEDLEDRVVERTAELAAANQELEAFTYSVSHDLRAPLRHIGGFSKILSEDFGPSLPEEAQSHLQRIEDGARRMGLLVDELLNLARVGRHALELHPTGLNAIVEEVISLLQPEAEGRAVIWKIAGLPSAQCDPVLIKQVFQNLIANALKFTRTRERALIEIDFQAKNGELIIQVRDNGVGFDMKYSDKLFGVFQRLHRGEDFEGTGIGLATVHRILHKHGGRVWAEAELDKGATFFFTLTTAESVLKKLDDANLNDANLNKDQPMETAAVEVENKSAAAGAEI